MTEEITFDIGKKPELDYFVGLDTIAKAESLTQYLRLPIYTSGDLNITNRILNNWHKEGLIVYPEKKWKRYNFADYIWIRIMEELRQFGFPLENLKKLRETLFTELRWRELYELTKTMDIKELPFTDISAEDKEGFRKFITETKQEDIDWGKMDQLMGKGFTFLELYITAVLGMKEPIVFLITPSDVFPVNEAKLQQYPKEALEYMNVILSDTHIKLPLMKIIKAFLVDGNLLNILGKAPIMEENEQRLLEIIHTGNYDSITIHFKDRKIKNLELNKTEDVKRRVVDILQDNEYQDIVIKSHKGLVTTIKNTIKVRFD